jgi:polyisoprenoid-binding protein YceI
MNRYRLDPGRSHFTVQAFPAGLLSAFAHSPTFAVHDFGGEMRLGETAQSFELDLTVDAGSLELVDRVREVDRREIEGRMRGEMLETSTYPQLSYRGRAVRADAIDQGRYRLAIDGELALHGVTRPHRMEAELIVFGDGLRLGGRDTLRMSDHRIKPVTAVGGTIKLKDELTISFDIAAVPEVS